jgi:cell division protein FtsI/penicillin-binding protein 2
MRRYSPARRLLGCALLLVLAFAGLGYRLVEIQALRHEELLQEARRAWLAPVVRATRRGQIVDTRRQLLAVSLPVKTVCADPQRMGPHYLTVAKVLAPLLRLPEADLARRLQPRKLVTAAGRTNELQYVVLKRNVALEEWEKVEEAMRNLAVAGDDRRLPEKERLRRQQERNLLARSVFAEAVDSERRYYPNGTMAAHVLGFTGIDSEPTPGAAAFGIVGKSGIEASYNAALSGMPGWRQTLRTSGRRELVALRPLDVAPRSGLTVVLALDAGIQHIVESELEEAYGQQQPESISCVVIRPETGEILALANLPTFDPNRPGDSPRDAWRNRVITDTAEPGSTFKALVVSGALDAGVVDLPNTFDCENGSFAYRGQRLGDVHPHGLLTVEEIIALSSNIGAAKIGIQLGGERLYRIVRAFGIGEPTRIPLGGEVSGVIHPPKSWSKISVAWIPMGHEVAITPLQMTMAFGALANRGRLMRPMLVNAFLDEQGQVLAQCEPTMVRQVVSEATARKMVRAMKAGVAIGTGKKAQLPFYEVAGKTGTAQKLVNGVYSHSQHFASFIGFFPADQPQLLISVFLDDPKKGMYGGETAAPVFRRIAERAAAYLAIPPTKNLESPLLTGNPPAGGAVAVAAGQAPRRP